MKTKTEPEVAKVDAITAQVIREYLESLAIEMSKIIERSAMHPLFNEVHDYSTGIFYFDGSKVHLIATSMATAVPNHIIASLLSVEAMLSFFGDRLNEGDVVILNDPYFGGTHNADWTIMKPLFLEGGAMLFPSVRAHMADSGGPLAANYNPSAREVWQEAFRITPIKLIERGQMREDVLRLVTRNCRIPQVLDGDLRAILGACGSAGEKLQDLTRKYGSDTVEESMAVAMAYAERRFRAEVSAWPDGEYSGTAILDHDSAGDMDIVVTCKLTVSGSNLSIDFSGTSPQTPGMVNSPFGNTASTSYAALLAVMAGDIPINSGLFAPVKITAPEGSAVNPLPPSPVMLATTNLNSEVGTAVMKALEQIVPDRVGAVANGGPTCASYGWDERYDQFFATVEMGVKAVNAGATCGVDGWGGWPTPSSAMLFSTIEMLELQFPFIYHQYEYVRDTAAAGQWRGLPAFAMKRESAADQFASLFVAGVRNRTPGWAGGRGGIANEVVLDYGTKDERTLADAATRVPLRAGSIVASLKAGGGGWGNPFRRDPELLITDVLDDIYSVEHVREEFGVVIDPRTMTIDVAATNALKRELDPDQYEARE